MSEEEAKAKAKNILINKESINTQEREIETNNRLSSSLKGLGRALKAALPNIIITALSLLSQVSSNVEGVSGNIVKVFTAGIVLIGTVAILTIKKVTAAMNTNWLMVALTAIAVSIRAIVEAIGSFANESTRAKEKAIEAAESTKEAWEETKRELEKVNDELKKSSDRLKELKDFSDKGIITLVEQEEYNKLQKTVNKLEAEKKLLEADEKRQKQDAEKQAANAIILTAGEGLSNAYVQEYKWWGNAKLILDTVTTLGLSEFFSGRGTFTDLVAKNNKKSDYINSILEKMRNDEDVSEQQTKALNDFYRELNNQKDMLTYYSGSNLEQWQKDANEAYETYWEYIHKLNIAQGESELVWEHVLTMEKFDGVEEKLTELANSGNVSQDTLRSLYDTNAAFKKMIDYLIELGIFSWDDMGKIKGLVNTVKGMANIGKPIEEQNKRLSKAISDYKDKFDILRTAVDEYNESGNVSNDTYNKVIKANKDYAKLFDFSNGKIELAANEINNLVDSLIAQYGATLAANDATEEQIAEMATLFKLLSMAEKGDNSLLTAFNNIKSVYGGKIESYEYLKNTYNNAISALESQGYDVSSVYYEKLKQIESQKAKILAKELSALTSKFREAIKSGDIKVGTDEYYDMNNAINAVKESIQESNIALQEYSNTIRDLEWKAFDRIQSEIDAIVGEAEYILDILNNKELVDKAGNLTEHGNTAMGLYAVKNNVYLNKAKRYADEIAKIEEAIANDPANQVLIDRKNELLELQRDSILSAEEEKQAMIDLIQDGIDSQIDALDDLIDKYTEALDSAKDLHDYQNRVSDATDEIGKLQKQIIAYENDTSEEAKMQIQQLKVDLQKAQEELQETEYNQFIADQKKLLDSISSEYSTLLNRRIDDVDSLIVDMTNAININADTIKTTLENTLENVGSTLSERMSNIWDTTGEAKMVVGDGINAVNEGITTVVSTLSTIDEDITISKTSLNNIDTGIKALAKDVTSKLTLLTRDNSGDVKNPDIPETEPNPNPVWTSYEQAAKAGFSNIRTEHEFARGSDDKKIYKTYTKYLEAMYNKYVRHTWTSYEQAVDAGFDNIRTLAEFNRGSNIDKKTYGTYQAYLDAMYQKYMPKYANGGLADFTGIAWLDGTKTNPEMVLDAKDTKNFIALRDMLSSMMDSDISYGNPLYSSFAPISYNVDIPDIADKMTQFFNSCGGTQIKNSFHISIPIDKVEDYNDFVTQLQKDSKFEKMIQAMTIGRINGGSPLDKYNYQWEKN